MEAVELRSPSSSNQFDITKCLFCQEENWDGNKLLSSAENGRSGKRIKEASEIRQDAISRRLASIGSDVYYYHMSNDCYKRYTSKSLLDMIVRKRKAGETETESVTESPLNTPAIPIRKTSRGAGRPSPNPLYVYSIDYKQKCIICNNYSYKKAYTKSRISESPRAKAFIKASTFFQDLVFTRTCDLQDEHSIFGADLYYHRNCMQNYLHKYESLSKEEIDNTELNVKQAVWSEAQELLEKCNSRIHEREVKAERNNFKQPRY